MSSCMQTLAVDFGSHKTQSYQLQNYEGSFCSTTANLSIIQSWQDPVSNAGESCATYDKGDCSTLAMAHFNKPNDNDFNIPALQYSSPIDCIAKRWPMFENMYCENALPSLTFGKRMDGNCELEGPLGLITEPPNCGACENIKYEYDDHGVCHPQMCQYVYLPNPSSTDQQNVTIHRFYEEKIEYNQAVDFLSPPDQSNFTTICGEAEKIYTTSNSWHNIQNDTEFVAKIDEVSGLQDNQVVAQHQQIAASCFNTNQPSSSIEPMTGEEQWIKNEHGECEVRVFNYN